jgi:hypothetical protein
MLYMECYVICGVWWFNDGEWKCVCVRRIIVMSTWSGWVGVWLYVQKVVVDLLIADEWTKRSSPDQVYYDSHDAVWCRRGGPSKKWTISLRVSYQPSSFLSPWHWEDATPIKPSLYYRYTNDIMVARYLRLSMVQHNVLRKLQLFRLTTQSAILSSEVLVILQTPAILGL